MLGRLFKHSQNILRSCTSCTVDVLCAFAVFDNTACYLKNATTLTPINKSGVTLVVVRNEPPGPPAPPTPGPAPPPPPLPPKKYNVVLEQHSPQPVLSHGNAVGAGYSPCSTTFNPAFVDVLGENTVSGVVVRTDSCSATNGAMSFAKCNLETGVCGDLEPNYKFPSDQGTEDPRIVWDPYTSYFYNFAYGSNPKQAATDGCSTSGAPGAPGACTVILSRTRTPYNASTWVRAPIIHQCNTFLFWPRVCLRDTLFLMCSGCASRNTSLGVRTLGTEMVVV